MFAKSLKTILVLIVLFCLGIEVFATNYVTDIKKVKSSELFIEIPIWIPGFRGRMSYGDVEIIGEGDSGDFLNQLFDSEFGLDFYFVGKVVWKRNNWSIQADVLGGQIRNSVDFKFNDSYVNSEIFTVVPRLFGSYKVYESELFNKQNVIGGLWIYAGVKYYHVNLRAGFNNKSLDFNVTDNWLDPIIGFTVPIEFAKWEFIIQNDYGGFGLTSEFSWWLSVNAQYEVSDKFHVNIGWVLQKIQYKRVVLNEEFAYSILLNGPMLGLSFAF